MLDAIVRCRTAALGGHRDKCVRCGHQAISYNSCRNRHCPKCQGNARAKWLAARSAELLPVPYFHVVFTLPHELSALVLQNKRLLYDLLFRTSAATLLELARDPKHLGADIGFLGVLHTWGQNLQLIPTFTTSFPPAALPPMVPDGSTRRHRFFLPVQALSRSSAASSARNYGSFSNRTDSSSMARFSTLPHLAHSTSFLRQLGQKDWVVYAKPPFGGAEHVLNYLARYTHRVAISNHRLVAFENDRVSFRWRDYAHGGKKKVMTVSADEFLRRFLLHVLPRGLVRIRHFGFFANRRRGVTLARCRELLGVAVPQIHPTNPELAVPPAQAPCWSSNGSLRSALLPTHSAITTAMEAPCQHILIPATRLRSPPLHSSGSARNRGGARKQHLFCGRRSPLDIARMLFHSKASIDTRGSALLAVLWTTSNPNPDH